MSDFFVEANSKRLLVDQVQVHCSSKAWDFRIRVSRMLSRGGHSNPFANQYEIQLECQT